MADNKKPIPPSERQTTVDNVSSVEFLTGTKVEFF